MINVSMINSPIDAERVTPARSEVAAAQRPGKAPSRQPAKAKQKFSGPVRVKYLPPTVAEAVAAAQGLADDIEGQIEIAAGLMGVSADEVRDEVVRAAKAAEVEKAQLAANERVIVRDRTGSERAVVVQRAGRVSRPTANAHVTVERTRPAVIVERTRSSGTLRPAAGRIRTFDLTRSGR